MENRESSYYRRDGASRPPQREDASSQRESALFTELPLNSVRRTPNSGRPAPEYTETVNETRRAARPAAETGRTAPRAVPYTPQSRPAQSYTDYSGYANTRQPQPRQQAPYSGGRSTAFTEISWDALRSGNLEQNATGNRRAAPAQPQTDAYGRTAQPQADPYRSAAQPRQTDPYYSNAAQPRSDSYSRPAQPQQGSDPYRRSDGSYRQPYATGGYRAAPQPSEQERDPFYGANIPQGETPPRSYGASQRSHGDYYRPGAVRRPVQRGTAGRASNSGTPPRRPPSNNGGGGFSFRLPRIGKNRLHPAFLLIALVLVGLLIFGIVKLVQKGNEKPMYTLPSYAPVTATPRPADTPQPGDATPEASAEVSMTPKPTAVPTPTPSGAKAKRDGDLIVPADWGATVPERAEAVYDSHFDRSCMIGNSLVEGFFMWSGITNMKYIHGTGAVVNNVLGTLDLSPLTLNDSDYYQDIYLMFGLNEVGTDVNSFVQSYKTLIEYVREHQTKANIYIISVTPVTQDVDADPNEVQSMERINAFNSALKQLCADNNCWYLDIYSMLVDEYGYLSSDYAFAGDGKHFEKSGYVAWANYMKTHYVDEGLLTE